MPLCTFGGRCVLESVPPMEISLRDHFHSPHRVIASDRMRPSASFSPKRVSVQMVHSTLRWQRWPGMLIVSYD